MTTAAVEHEPDVGAAQRRARRQTWTVTFIAVAIFWLISTSGRPWDLVARGGFSSDFYDEQARVFLRGRIAVDPAVPGPEGFLIDGATYLYYGPFLAIIRMPLMLFGDLFVGRLVRVSMLIALVVLARWADRLAIVARRSVCPLSDATWPRVAFVAAVLGSPALFASGWISVYNETELWALALAVVTVTLTVEWAADGFTDRRTLVLAGGAALATTLTRAPIGFGVSFALGVCGLVLVWRARRVIPARPVALLAVVVGALPVVAHMLVNLAKFGTLMSVPGDRQLLSLTSAARAEFFERTGGSFFSLRFLPTTLAQYLRPDTIRFERLVPGMRYGPLAPDYADFPVESTTPAASITVSALLLVVFAVIGVTWLVRRRGRLWLAVVVATSLGALPTFLIGFVANRYLIDMLPPLIVAAAIGVWLLVDIERRQVVQGGVAVLAVWGLWVNASLAIWNIGYKTVGFTEARYSLDDAFFGGGHDSLVIIDEATPVPRDGIVGVTRDCSGVWIAEQGRWVALDRPDGVRQATGALNGDGVNGDGVNGDGVNGDGVNGDRVLAAGVNWQLSVEGLDSPTPRTIFTSGDVVMIDEPLDAGDGRYTVTVDAIENLFFAQIGNEAFFLPGDVVRDDVDIRLDMSAPMPQSALCLSLSD